MHTTRDSHVSCAVTPYTDRRTLLKGAGGLALAALAMRTSSSALAQRFSIQRSASNNQRQPSFCSPAADNN